MDRYDKRHISRELIWEYALLILIFGLGIVLFRQIQSFISGILGAMTLYILLRKPAFRLTEKTGRSTLSASIILVCVILFIVIPLSLLVWFIISKLQQVNWNTNDILAPIMQTVDAVKDKFGINLVSEKSITFMAGKVTALGQSVINGIGDFFINVAAALVVLFFLLTGGKKMEDYLSSLIPMKKVNKMETIDRINVMVKSNAIGIPLLALIQGLIAWVGYVSFGVPNAFLSAFMTGLCSMVPIVGTMVIWIPIGIYFAVIGLWGKAIGIILFGAIFISQSDNLIRFILQKKLANTHPLITISGVVIGLPLFGFMGIIFGPLLVSLFLLFLDMFRKEYLSEDEDKNENETEEK
ncbi:MAG TPA: AI-2E family transporter [Candidatus Cryptobacteroides intestinipullorum]|nr:AI-2E family transporter [Candidatus Cryptobacteroides intestinipullorum]